MPLTPGCLVGVAVSVPSPCPQTHVCRERGTTVVKTVSVQTVLTRFLFQTLLKKDGCVEIKPPRFCEAKHEADDDRLLVVIRNKDISSHIHNVRPESVLFFYPAPFLNIRIHFKDLKC